MGRMKVYGGSWDLPGVPVTPNPFTDDLVRVEDDVPEAFFSSLPMIGVGQTARSAPSAAASPSMTAGQQKKPAAAAASTAPAASAATAAAAPAATATSNPSTTQSPES